LRSEAAQGWEEFASVNVITKKQFDEEDSVCYDILEIEYTRRKMATILTENQTALRLKLELATKFFRALGDPSRLKILDSLLEGEKNVGELVELVGSSQGRVSNHLACLKQCGFVNTRREGKFVYYSIADERVRSLLETSLAMIADNAEAIWACTRVSASSEEERL
jgi:DNA-binding transcriptional ArsR family regulator